MEPYYIYKKEDEHPFRTAHSLSSISIPLEHGQFIQMAPWTFGGEFAYQFGEYDGGRDRDGYGGYIFGKRKFADMTLKPEFELRFVYLSGDDPDTDKNENWDPLFAKAPYWNELLIYVQIYEFVTETYAMPGYWSNIQLYQAKVSMELAPDTKLSLATSTGGQMSGHSLWLRLRLCSTRDMKEVISRHYFSRTNSIRI